MPIYVIVDPAGPTATLAIRSLGLRLDERRESLWRSGDSSPE